MKNKTSGIKIELELDSDCVKKVKKYLKKTNTKLKTYLEAELNNHLDIVIDHYKLK
jgi:hypothetical protein